MTKKTCPLNGIARCPHLGVFLSVVLIALQSVPHQVAMLAVIGRCLLREVPLYDKGMVLVLIIQDSLHHKQGGLYET